MHFKRLLANKKLTKRQSYGHCVPSSHNVVYASQRAGCVRDCSGSPETKARLQDSATHVAVRWSVLCQELEKTPGAQMAGKILNRGVAEMNGVSGSTINIYLLVHNRLVCDVLLRVFRKRSGLTVVGTGYDRTEAFEKL